MTVNACETCQYPRLLEVEVANYESGIETLKSIAHNGVDLAAQGVRIGQLEAEKCGIDTAVFDELPQPERDYLIDNVSSLSVLADDFEAVVYQACHAAESLECGDHSPKSCPRYERLIQVKPELLGLTKTVEANLWHR